MEYPEVTVLVEAAKRLHISVSHGSGHIDVNDLYYRWIEFCINDETLLLPIMDEYDDALELNPVVMLNMALVECEMIEETSDFTEWCKESGVRPDHPNASKLYNYLKKSVKEFRHLVGNELEPIPYFDIELNTGKARALREAVIE